MRCEVIAIGTELLLGQITDTNSSWMGGELALAGIDSHYQTKVGDNLERMVECIRQGLNRSDAVITCGGLGPTQDDITRAALCAVMNVEMIHHPEIAERIRTMFASRGRSMPNNNLQQADVPEGATVIPQQPGTAPGLICPVDNKVIYAVPGVPHEMRTMMTGTILPDLKRRAGLDTVIKSRVLKTWGHSESRLSELLADRITELDETGNPTLAFQASGIDGIKVRITAKAHDASEASKLIAAEETRVRELLGRYIFGADEQSMESVVLDLLRSRGMSLALAEITSGGIASARLSAIDPSGDVFYGSVIPAAGKVRQAVLGLPATSLGTADAAGQLAEGVRTAFGTSVGLSTTGQHDLGGDKDSNAGLTYLGIALGGQAEVEQVRLPGDRERVRQYSVISLLNALRLRLLT